MTFVDISQLKAAQQQMAEAQIARKLAEAVVATVRQPLVVLDSRQEVVSVNRAFAEAFLHPGEQIRDRSIYQIGGGQWDRPELRRLLETILPADTEFEGLRVDVDVPGAGRRSMLLNARRIAQESQGDGLVLLGIEDVTDTEKKA